MSGYRLPENIPARDPCRIIAACRREQNRFLSGSFALIGIFAAAVFMADRSVVYPRKDGKQTQEVNRDAKADRLPVVAKRADLAP